MGARSDERSVQRINKTLPEKIASAEIPVMTRFMDSNLDGLVLWVTRKIIERFSKIEKEWSDRFKSAKKMELERSSAGASELLRISMSKLIVDYHSRISIAPFVKFFEEKDARSYIVQKDFWDTFKKVRLGRLNFTHLPEKFVGHVEIPEMIEDLDHNLFRDIFVYVGPLEKIENAIPGAERGVFKYEHDGNGIVFGYVDRNTGKFGYILRPFPVNKEMLVSEAIVGGKFAKPTEDSTSISDDIEYEVINDYPDHARILFNLLMYLHSGNPDLRSYIQTPRLRGGPGSSPVNKDKDLATVEVILVGFSYKKSPLYTVGKWDVRMHERLIKDKDGRPRLIFVEPHERTRRKTLLKGVDGEESS